MMNKRLSILCAISVLMACNNNPNREPKRDTALLLPDNTEDNFVLPDQQDSALMNKLVITGVFGQQQVNESIGEMDWTGIFRNDTGYYAEPTRLFATRIPEQAGDTTDIEIAADNKDSLLIAASGKLGLPSGYIKSVKLPEDALITESKSLRLQFGETEYELSATGAASRYRLYLTTTRNGEKRAQLIGAAPGFKQDDGMVLLFAGDLDGDGYLDLLIDTAADDQVETPTLYLSRFAEGADLVKVVGYFNIGL